MRLATGSATVAMSHRGRHRRAHRAAHPGVHPELLAIATGAGSLIFSHVNDGGFWLVKEYFNMSVAQTHEDLVGLRNHHLGERAGFHTFPGELCLAYLRNY